jgi:hypothetical protein
VPVLTPYLSSLWLALVTPTAFEVGRHLIEGLKNPTVVRDKSALEVFPAIRPMGIREAKLTIPTRITKPQFAIQVRHLEIQLPLGDRE